MHWKPFSYNVEPYQLISNFPRTEREQILRDVNICWISSVLAWNKPVLKQLFNVTTLSKIKFYAQISIENCCLIRTIVIGLIESVPSDWEEQTKCEHLKIFVFFLFWWVELSELSVSNLKIRQCIEIFSGKHLFWHCKPTWTSHALLVLYVYAFATKPYEFVLFST